MKVILLKDVARIGKKYEVKDVPDGHALNFLIPNKYAEPATAQSLKSLEKRAEKKASEEGVLAEAFALTLKKLGEEKAKLVAEANEKGHLFSGLHQKEIAEALSANTGTTIEPELVVLEAPIKEVGDHTITLERGDIKGEITIEVIAK